MMKKIFFIWLCLVLFLCAFNNTFGFNYTYQQSMQLFAGVVNSIGNVVKPFMSFVLPNGASKEVSEQVDAVRSEFYELGASGTYWDNFRQIVLYCDCGGRCFEDAKHYVINAFYGDCKAYLSSDDKRAKNIFERAVLKVGIIGSIYDYHEEVSDLYAVGLDAGFSCDNILYFSSSQGFEKEFLCPYLNGGK